MSLEATGLITMLALIFLAFVSILAAMVWFVMSDQKVGFDEAQARRDAEEILADAAHHGRGHAGQCATLD